MTASHARSQLLTVEEAALQARVGRTTMYRLIAEGDVKSIKIGRLRRVPVGAVTSYVERELARTAAA